MISRKPRLALAAIFVLSAIALAPAEGRGLKVIAKDGTQLGAFKASYALVIGETKYTAGWPKLPGVANDVAIVKKALEDQGFAVTLAQDLSFEDLKGAYEDFIDSYGLDEGNRLLFYYAGHGHTLKLAGDRDMGYIVPVDAPNPNTDATGFKKKAIPMQLFDTWAKGIEARHALFLFDSCFSGSIFAISRAVPANINEKTLAAVRQFITSGSADETVPDKSVFREMFVAGIGGDADRNGDSYVTGAELGEYLDEKVVNYSNASQHPQYGKIRDAKLDRGDFVFAIPVIAKGSAAPVTPSMTVTPAVAPSITITRAYGSLSVSAASAGALYLDGNKLGDLPAGAKADLTNIEVGDRVLQMRYNEGSPESIAVTVTEGAATAVGFTWKKPSAQAPATVPIAQGNFVRVPAGSFTMGSPSSEPRRNSNETQHQVTLSAFSIGKYEVTFDEYDAYCAATGASKPSDSGWGRGSRPVINVSWYDAVAYCNWLSRQEGLKEAYTISGTNVSTNKGANGYRLPTEAEWEYACRARTTTATAYGNTLVSSQANFDGNYSYNVSTTGTYLQKTAPVGSYQPNAWGIFDMHGNVWEWCQDWYGDYSSGSQTDPTGAASGSSRVNRGGCWGNDGQYLRSAYRSNSDPEFRISNLGFRLLRP